MPEFNRPVYDNDRNIDWGQTSADYARYRPGPPENFFKKLQSFEIGLSGQKVLDQGTGTGVLARQFARQGAVVSATDLSENQIKFATELAKNENLKIEFSVAPAEKQPFEDQSFDVITALSCVHYFDFNSWAKEVRRLLKSDGLVMVGYFAWVPHLSEIASATEKLVLKHNPDWGAHSYSGEIRGRIDKFEEIFHQVGLCVYEEDITFNEDTWRGRLRALRGIGASLTSEQVNEFDREHAKILKGFKEPYSIPHQFVIRVYKLC